MNLDQKQAAKDCLEDTENNRRAFPQIVEKLISAGFEGYLVDYRHASARYYLPSGESAEFPMSETPSDISARFDAAALQNAIHEAQANAPGYTYRGFCAKAKAAGCAGYIVSFLGRKVVYFSRSADVHVEPFPTAH